MARVKCTIANASRSINGVTFEHHGGVWVSTEVDAEVAARFLRIPGFELVDDTAEAVQQPPAQAAPEAPAEEGAGAEQAPAQVDVEAQAQAQPEPSPAPAAEPVRARRKR